MPDPLRTALVIGGATPLGRIAGEILSGAGMRTILADTVPAASPAPQPGGDGAIIFETVDLSDGESIAALIAKTLNTCGCIDLILFCGELSAPAAPIRTGTLAGFDALIEISLKRLFLVMRHGMPPMVARGQGSVVVACSVAALAGIDGNAPFAAANHAMLGLTRAAAMDVATSGVTVNALCLGLDSQDEGQEQMLRDAADTALFLCTPGARSITAAHLVIDGGQFASLPPVMKEQGA